MILSVWEHNDGLGLLFVTDQPYNQGRLYSPSTVSAFWVDVTCGYVSRVPAFADRDFPRPGFETRIDTKG